MGVLELDIPPIELHASTQCDIRTVEKAKFLSDVGFSQIVLARELNLNQIRDIHQATDATIEFFIHGALCVAIPVSATFPTPRRAVAPTVATVRRPAVCRIP